MKTVKLKNVKIKIVKLKKIDTGKNRQIEKMSKKVIKKNCGIGKSRQNEIR